VTSAFPQFQEQLDMAFRAFAEEKGRKKEPGRDKEQRHFHFPSNFPLLTSNSLILTKLTAQLT
jgi:hypothetical protein